MGPAAGPALSLEAAAEVFAEGEAIYIQSAAQSYQLYNQVIKLNQLTFSSLGAKRGN